MILEIEYYKKDTLLLGKSRNFTELKKQLETTEILHDSETDNFVEMLCRNYDWTIIETDTLSDYIYDRDIKVINKCNY